MECGLVDLFSFCSMCIFCMTSLNDRSQWKISFRQENLQYFVLDIDLLCQQCILLKDSTSVIEKLTSVLTIVCWQCVFFSMFSNILQIMLYIIYFLKYVSC